ncbi:hypothetical protein COV19_01120 [Candidatus Woesearchaeota archaeon CG10_big_fil_rev_8_21_14_0_10_44_13]|nr:MAG: hypothetical protein COV19_01120 [Candidatus Woesearchaeota archaeon CG10_big_fil_rev_8_21_14_0_10_44_13]
MKAINYLMIVLLLGAVFAYGCNSGKDDLLKGNDTNESGTAPDIPGQNTTDDITGNESEIDRLVVNEGENLTLESNGTELNPDTLVTEPGTEEGLRDLEVTFLDVGYGDSVFVKAPHNGTLLVDGGPNEAGSKIINLLRNNGAGSMLDVMIATHPDAETIGGLDAVAFNLAAISETYDNGQGSTSQDYIGYEQFSKAKGFFTVVKEDTTINLDEAMEIEMIVPYVDGYMNQTNDNSLVVKMTYGSVSMLLMGDCTLECEKKIMGHDLKADVILLGHSGGNDTTSQELLDNVKPRLAIISTGPYHEGYPSADVLTRLAANNIEVLRTDMNGTIIVKSDGKSFTARAEK